MSPEHRQNQRFLALDPARSVVVEACAGSGKTWLLSGRLLRLLLAGVKPGEILAITYTRKAAREIEARLRSLLADLARTDDAAALKILTERGLSAADAAAALPRARGLFEAVLAAEPAITITTFHGWFARLLGGAPLQSGVAGRTLDEAASSLLDEAWGQLAADCARAPDGPVASALLWLYAEVGRSSTEKLLKAFVDRRAEWHVWRDAQGGMEAALAALDATFGAGSDPFADCFTPARLAELEEFARLLGQNTAGDQALGNALAQAVVDLRKAPAHPSTGSGRTGLEDGSDSVRTELVEVRTESVPGASVFEAIRAAFLTKENKSRASRKPGKEQAKRLGSAGEDNFLRLHAEWSARLIAAIEAQQDLCNAVFNRHALAVGEALLAKLDELKRARRVMDFGDLEAEVDALLHAEGTAAWLQARLDARYKHILLDEFQDTNPLQWRILRAWLDAYDSPGIARPRVFLVGDPKQSIYRFRRAEPRLFAAASDYFAQAFGAVCISNAHTFRNAPGVVELVNAVFAGQAGFSPQTTEQLGRPARVELLPLIPVGDAQAETSAPEGMRNPLFCARIEAEDQRRSQEAALLAGRIQAMVGRWQVEDRAGLRPARYSDVLILTRRKSQLGIYEAALRAAGIPFVSPGQGGLLATLEAQDLLAVLRFLADPADNLMLAHALRTPAFALSDEDLLAISAQAGAWWPGLRALAAAGGHAGVQRAVRLLDDWLSASAHLPAHDLIDRIFHQSDWFARCRSALPEALWPGVHANLLALLELALNVDAGRYPSLTRFVDELRRLSRSDEEAPDEGLVAAAGEGAASGGRVRIMTIHGAKGLEAPIVWLIDANAPTRNGEGYGVVLDWPAGASAPGHFSLLGRLGEAGPARQAMLEAERAAAEREELNLLYVAITRAEQVFIASGIEAVRGQNAATPWQRLAAALSVLAGESLSQGVLPELPGAQVAALPSSPNAAALVRKWPAVGSWRRAPVPDQDRNQAGMVFGTRLHAWLEAATAGRPLPRVPPEVEAVARRLLARPALQRFFDPACYRRAGNETSFINQAGKAGRIDRWVELDDAIWVLDYKSGHPGDASLMQDYRSQLADYRELMRSIFPGRPVKAMLIFTEGGELCLE